MKLLLLLVVILITAVVETLVDNAAGIDLSHLSSSQKIIHNTVAKAAGAAIAAVLWFA